MTDTTHSNAPAAIKIESATSEGDLAGYRLSVGPHTCVVFADQQGMPGFRDGHDFTPEFGKTMQYQVVATVPAPVSAGAQDWIAEVRAHANPEDGGPYIFKRKHLPVGTKLYTAPQPQAVQAQAAPDPELADVEAKMRTLDELAGWSGEDWTEFLERNPATAAILRGFYAPKQCSVPPAGWTCTRTAGHDGPCAAVVAPALQVGAGEDERTQPFYDLAWQHGARQGVSFAGDELESLTFSPDDFEKFCTVLADRAARGAAAVPEGWKLVLLEPTAAMCKAAADAWLDCGSRLVLNKAGAAVRAGIAASPAAPVAAAVQAPAAGQQAGGLREALIACRDAIGALQSHCWPLPLENADRKPLSMGALDAARTLAINALAATPAPEPTAPADVRVPSDAQDTILSAAGHIAYAIFNLAGKKLADLPASLIDTTDAADAGLLAERALRNLAAEFDALAAQAAPPAATASAYGEQAGGARVMLLGSTASPEAERLMTMLLRAFGSRHPAMDDLVTLVMRSAPAASSEQVTKGSAGGQTA